MPHVFSSLVNTVGSWSANSAPAGTSPKPMADSTNRGFERGTVQLCRKPFLLASLRPLRLCAQLFGLGLRAEAQRPQRQTQTFSTKQDSPLFETGWEISVEPFCPVIPLLSTRLKKRATVYSWTACSR